MSVHECSQLSDAEKLVYLCQALRDGVARSAIEGLSRSGEHYKEAVECLCSRFDRPRLIHQAHVRKIIEAPSLRDGSGKDLRRFHDTMQQHLRALKAMGHEPPGPFLTSLLELKLDVDTTFEWRRHSQSSTGIPHYHELLDFVNLRAQASETANPNPGRNKPPRNPPVNSFAADVNISQCVVCKEKHPLYACPKFNTLPHKQKLFTIRDHHFCMNCLGGDHFIRNCRSNNRCKKCQKPHHTLLHTEVQVRQHLSAPPQSVGTNPIVSNTATGLMTDTLMMTCRILVCSPDGSSVEARALLDSASSASFVSERLAQTLCLSRSSHSARISGIAGLSHGSPIQSVTTFSISAIKSESQNIDVTAIIVPKVTCDLPHHPISFDLDWNHLSGIDLADPHFGQPGKIDVLLGVDIFVQVLRNGRRTGPPGSPVSFETEFGWVQAGEINNTSSHNGHVTSHHVSLENGDDILRKFWEIEQQPLGEPKLTPEEKNVVQHFRANHVQGNDGRFIVPLPRKPDAKKLGESRSQAVRRFLSLERSLHARSQFAEVDAVIREYFDMGHAEPVPAVDLRKPECDVFYLPIHVVRKESSSTTKIRAVFDASAKTSSGVSLNETFLVGPTLHPPLVDVLLRFHSHRIALTTDVSKMYRAVGLVESDKDLHRFVWRSHPGESLQDYRMIRVTFGVSASSFAVNMSLQQNADNFAHEFPVAVKAVHKSFYVDDGLTGADSVAGTIILHKELQELFARGNFQLHKWNSSSPEVLAHIPPELRESQVVNALPCAEDYSKTLGLEWNSHLDHFRLTASELPHLGSLTKRALVSDVAKVLKMKILLQRVWEVRIGWDDVVPTAIQDVWYQWGSELPLLTRKQIPRCFFLGISMSHLCSSTASAMLPRMRMQESFIFVSLMTRTMSTYLWLPLRRKSPQSSVLPFPDLNFVVPNCYPSFSVTFK